MVALCLNSCEITFLIAVILDFLFTCKRGEIFLPHPVEEKKRTEDKTRKEMENMKKKEEM